MPGSPKGLLVAVIAGVVMLALVGPAAAAPYDYTGQHGGIYAPVQVNARGTDVAAPDQQASAPIDARGTDVAAPDQQAPVSSGPGAAEPVGTSDDTLPTPALLSLLALGLGLASASWFATSRRRHRTPV